METARRRATALLSQLDPSLLDESRGPEMSRKKKTGPMWAQQCDVCVWSPMFFFFCGDPCGRSIMDCQVVMCNYFFVTGINVSWLKLQTYNLFFFWMFLVKQQFSCQHLPGT